MAIKSWIRASLGILMLGLVVVTGISYRTMAKITSRPAYPLKRQEKFKKVRDTLKADYRAQEVSFTAEDGIKLSGLLIERPKAQRAVLICHGYGMTKEEMHRYITLFPHDTLLLFDFRSHGQSEGAFISIGHYEQRDVKAAVTFLRALPGLHSVPLIGMGVSMGGATLLGAAAHGVSFNGLIIDSSFSHLPEQIAYSFGMYTGLPKPLFMPMVVALYTYTYGCTLHDVIPAQSIATVKCPLLLIHSEADVTAPVQNVHTLFAAVQHEKKSLWVVKEAKHAFILHTYPDEYAAHINDFLARI